MTTSENFSYFPAVLTDEQSRDSVNAGWAPVRRLALHILTMDSTALLDSIVSDDDAQGYVDLVEYIIEYQKWRESDSEMIDSALTRLLVVLDEKARQMGITDDEDAA